MQRVQRPPPCAGHHNDMSDWHDPVCMLHDVCIGLPPAPVVAALVATGGARAAAGDVACGGTRWAGERSARAELVEEVNAGG